MMQHASADNHIELLVQLGGILDRQLPRFEIGQVVLPLQRVSVLETGRGDVDANDAGAGMSERELCGLPRSAAGHEDFKIGAVLFVGPQQMVLRAMDVFVLPQIANPIEIFQWRRVGMTSVEVADETGIPAAV